MFRLELLLICVYLTKLLLASDKCTDDTPWFCEYNVSTYDFEEEGFVGRTLTDSQYKHIKHHESEIDGPIPEEFDLRKAWSQCKSISRIMNQGRCGICWAACATSVMSDRLCIASKGKDPVEISINDIVTCCEKCSNNPTHRCSGGGSMKRSYEHFIDHGVVSSKCKPYYEIKKLKIPNVPCENKCTVNSSLDYNEDKRRGSYVLTESKSTTIKDVQIEIIKNGPVCAYLRNIGNDFGQDVKKGMLVFPRNYSQRSVHTGRIVGWGTKNGTPYWIVGNTWGINWGDKGFFKIRRGTNELGIETKFFAVGIDPNAKTKKDIIMKPAGHTSGSHLIQSWKFIPQIYILHLLYTITRIFFI